MLKQKSKNGLVSLNLGRNLQEGVPLAPWQRHGARSVDDGCRSRYSTTATTTLPFSSGERSGNLRSRPSQRCSKALPFGRRTNDLPSMVEPASGESHRSPSCHHRLTRETSPPRFITAGERLSEVKEQHDERKIASLV